VVACCLACEAGGVSRPGVVDLRGAAVKAFLHILVTLETKLVSSVTSIITYITLLCFD
jgi:hypothetical protein